MTLESSRKAQWMLNHRGDAVQDQRGNMANSGFINGTEAAEQAGVEYERD
jgi:hypothetical protein